MRHLRYLIVLLLIGAMALPALAGRKKAIKDPKALLTSAKIAMGANPPRHDEAMGYLDTILAQSGPMPEAYFHRGNIFGEYANKEYDLEKKLDILTKMSANYDSLFISCEDENIKKKLRKDCGKFGGIIDSVRALYWRDNYNEAVHAISMLDEEYIPNMKNAVDSTAKAEAETALSAAADSSRLYFLAAMTVDPSHYRTYEGIGIIYDRLGQYDSSAVWFEKAYKIVPDSASIIQNIAYAYIQMSDWDKSITWFNKLLEKVPDNVSTITNIAICYNNKKMYDSSFVYNKMAIELDSTASGAYIDAGQYFLLQSQQRSDSIRYYQKADDSTAARRFMKLRDQSLDSSAAYFREGIKLEPENIQALEQYGIVKMVLGDYPEAEISFKKLTELEPFQKDHWINLGDNYIQMQKFEEATEPYEKAVELDPGDTRLWEILSDLYESAGLKDKANEAKAKAEELKNL